VRSRKITGILNTISHRHTQTDTDIKKLSRKHEITKGRNKEKNLDADCSDYKASMKSRTKSFFDRIYRMTRMFLSFQPPDRRPEWQKVQSPFGEVIILATDPHRLTQTDFLTFPRGGSSRFLNLEHWE
jgi:hypothetical protein